MGAIGINPAVSDFAGIGRVNVILFRQVFWRLSIKKV
jgi:hypothetical protein